MRSFRESVEAILGPERNNPPGVVRALRITNPLFEIERTWKRFGVVQLRQRERQRKLVVGCGNRPVAMDGIPLVRELERPGFEVPRWSSAYVSQHAHIGWYSIDYDTGMNPCIVAEFGRNDLRSVLPEMVFDEILFESMFVMPASNSCAASNLIHLLIEGGMFEISNRVETVVRTERRGDALVDLSDGSEIRSEVDYAIFAEKLLHPKI